MHSESGYWRPKPDGTIEVVIAQSNGLVEVQVLVFNLFIFISRINCLNNWLHDLCVYLYSICYKWWI
jgi:hypothetical protein